MEQAGITVDVFLQQQDCSPFLNGRLRAVYGTRVKDAVYTEHDVGQAAQFRAVLEKFEEHCKAQPSDQAYDYMVVIRHDMEWLEPMTSEKWNLELDKVNIA